MIVSKPLMHPRSRIKTDIIPNKSMTVLAALTPSALEGCYSEDSLGKLVAVQYCIGLAMAQWPIKLYHNFFFF